MTIRQSPRALIARSLMASAILLLAGCLESDKIVEVKGSPDGRRVAVANASGELGVLNLAAPGSLPIFTTYLAEGFDWSPDSKALAFCERFPSQPTQLRLARPEEEAPSALLVGGYDWKGRPGWIGERKIAYLSSQDSDHVNIWAVDVETTTCAKLVDAGEDATGLWTCAATGAFAFSRIAGDRLQLWWQGPRSPQPVPLARDPDRETLVGDLAGFFPDGKRFAYVRQREDRIELVCHDLRAGKDIAVRRLDAAPQSLACLPGGRAIVEIAGRLHDWNPKRLGFFGDSFSEGRAWNKLPLTAPSALGKSGLAAVVKGNILATAESWRRVEHGKINARGMGDLLALAGSLQMAGQSAQAQTWIADLEAQTRADPAKAALVSAHAAWLARLRGDPRETDRRLAEVIVKTESMDEIWMAAWHERLLGAFFEGGGAQAARQVLESMPEAAASQPLVRWIRGLVLGGDPKIVDPWQKAGRTLRRHEWPAGAQMLLAMVEADPKNGAHREGFSLLMHGDLEPLAGLIVPEQSSPAELARQAQFQQAFIKLSDAEPERETTTNDLRGLLLLMWAKSGELEAARTLVMTDLTDPEGSSLDYFDILNRYLDAEEQEIWVQRAVREILFSERIAEPLAKRMSDPQSRLILGLARAKLAIIDGDMAALDKILAPLEKEIAALPENFWNRQTGRLLYFARLYRTKHDERQGRWAEAAAGYDASAADIESFPADWGITPFDVAWMGELVRRGQAEPEPLGFFLRAIQGLGDPLVNPAYEAGTLTAGMGRLDAISAAGAPEWLKPYVAYMRGYCHSLLGHPWHAIERFEAARREGAQGGLLARILIEEAAERSTLRQHKLAADLLSRLAAMPLPPPQRAKAIESLAQAERLDGLILSQDDRMRFLCKERRLPWKWAATLVDSETLLSPDAEGRPERP